MYYLRESIRREQLLQCLDVYIINDPGMRENDLNAIKRRCSSVLENTTFVHALQTSKKTGRISAPMKFCED